MLTWGSMSIGVVVALSAHPKRVFLDADHFDGELRVALIQELGAETIVSRREDAQLWVRVQAEERMQVEVIAPPDTTVVARSFSLRDGPQPAVRSVGFDITNAGTQTSGAFIVTVALSQNEVISVSDHLVADVQLAAITATTTATALAAFTLPAGIVPGTWYVGLIIDSGEAVTETSEVNNVARLGTVDVVP